MATSVDNKNSASAGPDIQSAAPPDGASGKSWGDRFKHRVFDSSLYVGFNYLFNTAFSVALAFTLKVKQQAAITKHSENFGAKIGEMFKVSNPGKFKEAFANGVQSLMLVFGGTLLVPVIKYFEDNRHSTLYKTGIALDRLQEKLGFGNAASRQNLEDHAKISQALKTRQPVELTDEERRRFAHKHRLVVNDAGGLEFKEHKLPWSKVLVARGAAIGAAYVTNFSLGLANVKGESFEKASDYKIADKFSVTGFMRKILPKALGGGSSVLDGKLQGDVMTGGRNVNNSTIMGSLLVNDTILTAAAASAHYVTQNHLHKPVTEDECLVPEARDDSPQMKKRREMASAPRGDLRAREDARRDAPAASQVIA